MNDRENITIINRVKRGEIHLYERLIEKYQRPLFIMIKNMVRERETAEDILQDAFFSAYRHLNTFDPSLALFSTWLFRIARNRCLNEIKRKKEERTSDMDDHPSDESPADDFMKKEIFAKLDNALERLPFNQKTVFVLAEIQELSLAEISAIEEVPLGTVKSRLSRAKEKLRILLTDYARPL